MIAACAILFFSFLSRFTAASHSNDAVLSQKGPSIEGRWNLIPVVPSDTAGGKLPYLIFDMRTKRVSGNMGCNNFLASFMVLNGTIRFSKNIASTRMLCQGYDEQTFADNLVRADGYEIVGDTLELSVRRVPIGYWLKQQ